MARVETDPNYSSPTFSRATAGTDLVKKEDIQALAAAMSTHTHNGAGTGLQVASIPASAISSGLITSAMIADGTIVAGDIADGAITSAKILDNTIQSADIVDGAVSAWTGIAVFSSTSTSSASPVVIPSLVTPSLTTVGRSVLVSGTITVQFGTASQNANLFLYRDSTQIACVGTAQAPTAGGIYHQMSFSYIDSASGSGLTAGAHTWSLYWSTNLAALALVSSAASSIYVLDMRR